MKKIINEPEHVLEQMLEGFVFANSHIVRRLEGTSVIYSQFEDEGKVALVSGGGSGHEPSHAGFVGKGMLSAAVCGEVFTSPTPDQVFEAIKVADQGAGVLLVIKNYTGDVMNFEMAAELAEMEGIKVEQLLVNDDIAVEDSLYTAGRRGVAGTVIVHKLLGAAAASGLTLPKVKAFGDKVTANLKTIGVAITAATVPAVGKPGFELAEDEMEYGVGIHGEPGYRREKVKPSCEIAAELVTKLKKDFNWSAGERYGLLINGLGATPLMEQFIFTNDVAKLLDAEGLQIEFKKVGSLMTSIDMAGISLTLLKIEDDQWINYWNEAVETTNWA